jgi:hypothetical protein
MKDRSRRACHSVPVAGESIDRITPNRIAEDKAALGKIGDEKKVSIAWVISDASMEYLSEELKKSEA